MRNYGLLRLALRLAGASLLYQARHQSPAARLADLPIRGLPISAPVEIVWDDHLVPFIAAESDRDLAVALGVVHAHLRGAQVELMRHAAQGRLSGMLGPVAVPLDHLIRVLDPTRAVPAIEHALPEPTRDWLEGFVAGLNHHQLHSRERPLELRLLGVKPVPWRVSDILDIARLAAADVTWLLWMRLLPLRHRAEFNELWPLLLADDADPAPPSSSAPTTQGALEDLVRGFGIKGSNAFAVAGSHTQSGKPFLGGDPHLSLTLPSVWLAAAYRSPSYNVAGLMIPGIPVMAIGRNPHLAWGGTNLHAASSELFDIGDLPSSEIKEERVSLAVRWEGQREITVRRTPYGPVLSDAPAFAGAGKVAFRWIGHEPSDEISALLAINRARSGAEFRRAAEGLAVPGQNLVYAEAAGGIGHIIAAHLPRRPATPPQTVVSSPAALSAWEDRCDTSDFPADINPQRGFVASANDRPPPSDIPVGWFFSPRDRAQRLAALLGGDEPLDVAALAAVQRDVLAPGMLELRNRFRSVIDPDATDPVLPAVSAWDGRYETDSAGALSFELVFAHVTAALVPPERRATFGVVWNSRRLIARDLAEVPLDRLRQAVVRAAAESAAAFTELGSWGAAHRLRLAHPLSRIPIIGRRWAGVDLAWPGSSDTLFKSGHGMVAGRHAVSYGTNGRYLFDMADPNGNYLVVLGGQDGAFGSAAFDDQLPLLQRGDYLRVPLQPEAARRDFPHRTVLEPA